MTVAQPPGCDRRAPRALKRGDCRAGGWLDTQSGPICAAQLTNTVAWLSAL